MAVKPGIEVLLNDRRDRIRGARVGAVVHPASVLPDFRHTADALIECGEFRLVSLFGPQHGARGEKQDNMVESEFYRDPDTGLPVHSLYGETRWPTEEMLQGLDVLLFDLQDVGTRVYTFIYTMAYCMEACARSGKAHDRAGPAQSRQRQSRWKGTCSIRNIRSFVGLLSDADAPRDDGGRTGPVFSIRNSE